MGSDSDRRRSLLTVESIGGERLEVSARGRLDASCRATLDERLAQLVSCKPVTLRIDLRDVTFIAPEIAATLARTRSDLADFGGRLELVGVSFDLAVALAYRPGRSRATN